MPWNWVCLVHLNKETNNKFLWFTYVLNFIRIEKYFHSLLSLVVPLIGALIGHRVVYYDVALFLQEQV